MVWFNQVARFWSSHQPVWLPKDIPKWMWYHISLIRPHDSVGNMCIMWMDLVQISPFPYGLLTQQQFKVTHVDFGTACDMCTLVPGISWRADRTQMSNFLSCVWAVNQPHWSCSARQCWLSVHWLYRLFQERAAQQNQKKYRVLWQGHLTCFP